MHFSITNIWLRSAWLRLIHGSDRAPMPSWALVKALYRWRTLFRKGQYDEAIEIATEAMRLAEDEFGTYHAVTWAIVYELGQLYHIFEQDHTHAAPLYRRALIIMEELQGPDSAVAQHHYDLGQIYQAQGNHAEATLHLKRAVALWERAIRPGDLERKYLTHRGYATSPRWHLVMGLMGLADLHRACGSFAEAARIYRRLLALDEKLFGSDSLYLAPTLEEHAARLREIGQFDEAAELEARAKVLWTKNK